MAFALLKRPYRVAVVVLTLGAPAIAQTPPPVITARIRPGVTNIGTPKIEESDSFKAIRAKPDDDQAVIYYLIENEKTNPPAYLFELSRRLLSKNPNEALKWYIIARNRLFYDAYRCNDMTVYADGQFRVPYIMMAKDVALYIEPHIEAVRKIEEKVLNSPDLFSATNKTWYVCSHGMIAISASMNGKVLSEAEYMRPQSQWPAIQSYLRYKGPEPAFLKESKSESFEEFCHRTGCKIEEKK